VRDNAIGERGLAITILFQTADIDRWMNLQLSPLDNALVHDWKERVRNHGPLTLQNMEQVMADEWNRIPASLIQAHYKHCGLVGYTNVYSDCTDPRGHRHAQ